MLKKEVWEAIKKQLECLLILGVVPLALLWDRWVMKFNWGFRDIFSAVFPSPASTATKALCTASVILCRSNFTAEPSLLRILEIAMIADVGNCAD